LNPPDPVPPDIAASLEHAAVRRASLGTRFYWYETVGSTNDVAARLAARGAPEGTTVAANAQTSGRGRLGREWVSQAGAGLYVSVVLRPAGDTVPLLTLMAGVAIADGIERATGLSTTVKWPNDLYAGGRKLAGVLAEGGEFVVLGFGINVSPAAYPPAIAGRATSIEEELGRPADRGLVLAECLVALATRYAELGHGGRAEVLTAWRTRAADTMGRAITWDGQQAIAEGVADDGALLVRTAAGLQRVISGEVRWM
jgi:BirA family biotin operon repressor/biotin-[acetyl-CoA-carboxylase] ligase